MPQYAITTGLPQLPAGQNEKDFALVKPLYLALNSLAQGLSVQSGGVLYSQAELSAQNQLLTILTQNHRKVYALAVGSTLAYGKIVNLYLSGGKIAAQYADASDPTKPAHGVVNNPLGIEPGEYGEIVLIEGYTKGIAGSALGTYYYLSTNGDIQPVAPTLPGTIAQGVGFGLGSAGFYLHVTEPEAAGGGGGGGVTSVSGTAPIVSSGGATPAISITAATTGAAGSMSAADKLKLDGIANGATANSSDAFLLNRANHTGNQPSTTISDFTEAAQDAIAALLVAGTNITLVYNDVANTLTINATAAGSVAATATTITVPYDSYDYLATVTDASVTGTSKVMIVPGMYAQTDVNLAADVQFNVESVAVGSFTVRLSGRDNESIGGPYNFFYLLG